MACGRKDEPQAILLSFRDDFSSLLNKKRSCTSVQLLYKAGPQGFEP